MLRPRKAGATAVVMPGLLILSVLMACAQSPQPQPETQQKAMPDYTRPQTYEESTRFLKSLPPKPATQLPYPSIATPPIEEQAPVPLLTEAQQKKMEEDLEKLAKGQGQPKKKLEKKQGEKAANAKKKKKDGDPAAPAAK